MTDQPPLPPSSTPPPLPKRRWFARLWHNPRLLFTVLTLLGFLIAIPFGGRWLAYRFTHSLCEDAFVESHIVNLGPLVNGHLLHMLAEEHDTVKAGQLLAEIDPLPYIRQLELAASKVEVAEANLRLERAALARLEAEVPRKIEIAQREVSVAEAEFAKAKHGHELTQKDVAKTISEAKAARAAAQAVLVNATEDYERYGKLFKERSVPERKFEDATKTYKTAHADVAATQAKLERAEANRQQVDIAAKTQEAADHHVQKAEQTLALAKVGELHIKEMQRQVLVRAAQVDEAKSARDVAQTNLGYTRIVAPFDGVVVKRYRNLGDFTPVGAPVMSLYNRELIWVTVNMEETRLEGIAAGNNVRLDVDAFREPCFGRVLWVGRATGANFALVPRDVSAGEFTKVVQRVPIRILVNKDERWPRLRPGLSVSAAIDHGPGDPEWARKAAAEELRMERGVGPVTLP